MTKVRKQFLHEDCDGQTHVLEEWVEEPVKRRCVTCRFWEKDKYYKFNFCEQIYDTSNEDEIPKTAHLFTEDPHGCNCFVTAPDFGCVLWEEKEEKC
jgi:hypothetical protein